MLLSTHRLSALLCCALIASAAQAEDDGSYPLQFRFHGEVGFDAWDISTNAESPAHERVLFLANSTPQWSERNPSPWVRFDSEVLFTQNTSGRFKFRGAQNTGWKIDELNVNWHVSPSLGASVGVVDYKTSWCRPYDVDSPWARENDPFCTVRTTDQATGAAPGIQIHTNFKTNDWTLQSHVGLFDPLVLDYNKKDFGNMELNGRSKVRSNNKIGAGVSWLHNHTATELRVGTLHTYQHALWDAYEGDSSLIPIHQRSRLLFVGLNVHPLSAWAIRLTHINEKMHGNWTSLFSDDRRDRSRRSFSIENIFRINRTNTVALAWSKYQIRIQDEWRVEGEDVWNAFPLDTFQNSLYSIAWRKDWRPWLYSAIQASRSDSDFDFFGLGTASPSGTAIGVRLGVRF